MSVLPTQRPNDDFMVPQQSDPRSCLLWIYKIPSVSYSMPIALLLTILVTLATEMEYALAEQRLRPAQRENGIFSSQFTNPHWMKGRIRKSLSTHPKRMRPVSYNMHEPPSFVTSEMNESIQIAINSPAYLHCLVRNQGDNNVAWIKNENSKLLTIQTDKFTSDGRFVMSYRPATNDYCLLIRYVLHNDSGSYACEIGTDPPIRFQTMLTVLEYEAAIFGPKSVWIGGTISLRCEIYLNKYKEEGTYHIGSIRWYHDRRAMVLGSKRFHVTDQKLSEDNSTLFAELNIMNVDLTDEGLYGCSASGITPKLLKVEINGPVNPALQPFMVADDPGANTAAQKNNANLPLHVISPYPGLFYIWIILYSTHLNNVVNPTTFTI